MFDYKRKVHLDFTLHHTFLTLENVLTRNNFNSNYKKGTFKV